MLIYTLIQSKIIPFTPQLQTGYQITYSSETTQKCRLCSQHPHSYQNSSVGCTKSYQPSVTLHHFQQRLQILTQDQQSTKTSHFILYGNVLTKIIFKQKKSTGPQVSLLTPKPGTKITLISETGSSNAKFLP